MGAGAPNGRCRRAQAGRAVVLGDKRWTFHLAGDGVPSGVAKAEAQRLRREALLQKRTEVCENAPGTFFTTKASADFLTHALQETLASRCCCGVDVASAPHGTIRLPAPSSSYALNFFSGPAKPKLKALGIQSYQYLWDRLGADVQLSRCAALPGIQLLPVDEIQGVVDRWCATQPACPARSNNTDCARQRVRASFEAEIRAAPRGRRKALAATPRRGRGDAAEGSRRRRGTVAAEPSRRRAVEQTYYFI